MYSAVTRGLGVLDLPARSG